jgi:hypothetical protein
MPAKKSSPRRPRSSTPAKSPGGATNASPRQAPRRSSTAKTASAEGRPAKPFSRNPPAKKSPTDKRRAAEVEKEFGKDVRRAAERSGRKPAVWQASERPESRESVRAKIGSGAVQRATTRTWEEWVVTLDAEGMQGKTHRDVVHHLVTRHELTPWWAQMVCVGYEQARAPRAAPETPSGIEISVQRTLDASASDIFRAFNDPTRRQWSAVPDYLVRTAVAPRSLRIGMPDGSIVRVVIERKGNTRCAVAVQHGQLADIAAADRAREQWRDSLARLAGLLSE